MKLVQAVTHFNTVTLDGWSGSAWVAAVAKGNFMAFDRFITERAFGQKKRLVEIGGAVGIPPQYEVVRTPDGTVYLAAAYNHDIAHDEVYGSTYLLQAAPFTAAIKRVVTAPSTYGIASTKTESTIATVFCDVERVTAETSREFDGVKYSSHVIALPASTPVTPDDEIEIAGSRYDVVEVNLLLRVKEVRAVRRGNAP